MSSNQNEFCFNFWKKFAKYFFKFQVRIYYYVIFYGSAFTVHMIPGIYVQLVRISAFIIYIDLSQPQFFSNPKKGLWLALF